MGASGSTDKLTIKVHKLDTQSDGNGVVRLTAQAEDRLREIQRETGYSARQLASMMIEFAAERIEIIEV